MFSIINYFQAHNIAVKLRDIAASLKQQLLLSCRCQFAVTASEREDPLVCDQWSPYAVVYRGTIYAYLESDMSSLIVALEDWVTTQPALIVDSQSLEVSTSSGIGEM